MNLTNSTKFPAAYTMGMEPSGRELLVVVAKATFTLPLDGGEPVPSNKQVPLVEADLFSGEPGLSAPLLECDFTPKKPKCDVILNGSAYAPGGKPAETVPVLLQVGPLSKSFNVVGNRAWVEDVFGWKATRPVPFVKMPISYGNAFGGRDLSDPDEKKHRWYGSNHAGVGFHSNLYAPLVEGKPLPNTEEIGKSVEKPDGKYRPMAFGPIGRAWEPRYKLAGTYDQQWLDNVCPFLPADFKDEYYQCAPADQQIPHPKGGELVVLVNLSSEGRLQFMLPSIQVPIRFFLRGGESRETTSPVDTVILEPDLRRLQLVWRVAHPLRRNIFEVEHLLVGRMSRGWYQARELGKFYAPSMAAAIRMPRAAPPGVTPEMPDAEDDAAAAQGEEA
jgi:hypothetical protein